MVCILFVLQLQRYKIFLDFCYILQSVFYSILHFIALLQRVGNFNNESTLESGIFEIPFDYHVHLGWFAAKDSSRENICKNHL